MASWVKDESADYVYWIHADDFSSVIELGHLNCPVEECWCAESVDL